MVIGILMLLFIGFNRIWHFVYVRLDAMLCGYLRVTRLSAAFITQIKAQLPGCVQQVLLRADGEFLSWESVQAAISCKFQFIIGNKGCTPSFDPQQWYRPWKRKDIEFNSCIYQPSGWGQACRFVAMRIPKEDKRVSNQPVQCPLFKDDCYVYRIFCMDLAGKAHDVFDGYICLLLALNPGVSFTFSTKRWLQLLSFQPSDFHGFENFYAILLQSNATIRANFSRNSRLWHRWVVRQK